MIKLDPRLLLLICALTWGSSFILIKEGLRAFTFLEVGALRLTIAGLCMAPIAIRYLRRKKYPFMPFALACLMGNLLPAFLYPLAQTNIGSAAAGVLNSLAPLFALITGVLFFWDFSY